MKYKDLKFGEITEIAPGCLLVTGRNTNPFHEASCGNVLLYKFLDTLYVINTGATIIFKGRLLEAIQKLKPFDKLTLINTDAYPENISNNDIINEIHVEKKQHFISSLEKEYLKNPGSQIINSLEKASHLIDLGNHPKHAGHKIVELFNPINASVETVQALDQNNTKTLYFGHAYFKGWELGDGAIKILQSSGYSPGSLIVYISHLKLLFAGNEIANFLPLWTSSNLSHHLQSLQNIRHMLNDKLIDILVGSLPEQVFINTADSLNFIEELLLLQARFDDYLRKNLIGREADGEGGATMEELYLSLEASPFTIHLPLWETYTKMLILNKLKKIGCVCTSPEGNKTRFILPK